jgi:hypothetical protein
MLSGTHRCIALLCLAVVIVMIAIAQPAMSRTAPGPAAERILDDSGGRIGTYLTKYEELRKSGQRVVIDGHLRVSMHASAGRDRRARCLLSTPPGISA